MVKLLLTPPRPPESRWTTNSQCPECSQRSFTSTLPITPEQSTLSSGRSYSSSGSGSWPTSRSRARRSQSRPLLPPLVSTPPRSTEPVSSTSTSDGTMISTLPRNTAQSTSVTPSGKSASR